MSERLSNRRRDLREQARRSGHSTVHGTRFVRLVWEHTYVHMRGDGPTTRYCGRCGREQALDQFHRAKDGHQLWCKSCKREHAAAHYQANRARRQAQNLRRHTEFLRWYTALKAGRPCTDCGHAFHPVAMHWDHLPGRSKTADLAALARRGSRKRVLDEIAKCELVCANCHAIRSHRRREERVIARSHRGRGASPVDRPYSTTSTRPRSSAG